MKGPMLTNPKTIQNLKCEIKVFLTEMNDKHNKDVLFKNPSSVISNKHE